MKMMILEIATSIQILNAVDELYATHENTIHSNIIHNIISEYV